MAVALAVSPVSAAGICESMAALPTVPLVSNPSITGQSVFPPPHTHLLSVCYGTLLNKAMARRGRCGHGDIVNIMTARQQQKCFGLNMQH